MKDTLAPMKRRILVVEDEEKLRRVLEIQLTSAGFDVDKARTAEEALKSADRADLVLTDLGCPRWTDWNSWLPSGARARRLQSS